MHVKLYPLHRSYHYSLLPATDEHSHVAQVVVPMLFTQVPIVVTQNFLLQNATDSIYS